MLMNVVYTPEDREAHRGSDRAASVKKLKKTKIAPSQKQHVVRRAEGTVSQQHTVNVASEINGERASDFELVIAGGCSQKGQALQERKASVG